MVTDSPHKPVFLVWFYLQNATTSGHKFFYHEYNNVFSFKLKTFIFAVIVFLLMAIKLPDTDF